MSLEQIVEKNYSANNLIESSVKLIWFMRSALTDKLREWHAKHTCTIRICGASQVAHMKLSCV